MKKNAFSFKALRLLLIALIVVPFGLTDIAQAQRRVRGNSSALLPAGTTVGVRTTEDIEADESDGRVFRGVVDQDIVRNGSVLIPRGSDVELIVRNVSDDELAVDMDAITVNGQRYGIESESNSVTAEKKEGIGANKRTGKYVGGGALLGAIIGGIAGGGKGAAIGAGAGAAAGAGAQVLTRGREVKIPAETLLTFRLQEPMRTGITDSGYTRDGRHYHAVNGATTAASNAYQAGLDDGRSDRSRNVPFDANNNRWRTAQERRDYEAGYQRGYNEGFTSSNTYSNSPRGRATVDIGNDNRVRWQAPAPSRVFVQVDNNRRQLFAEGQSGSQYAQWITPGHVYVFVVEDMNGNEIARDRLDLR
jgi:hypothetical protein